MVPGRAGRFQRTRRSRVGSRSVVILGLIVVVPVEHRDILVATESQVEGCAQSEHASTDDDDAVGLLRLAARHDGATMRPIVCGITVGLT